MKKNQLNLEIASKPMVNLPEENFTRGFEALNEKLQYNLAPPLGKHTDIWTRPAPLFPGAYLWDSSFITQAWKFWDPEIGLRALKPFCEFQQSDGRMPHMIFWGKQVSKLSNPPFLAWAVDNLLNYMPDEKWASFYIDPLTRFMEWRKTARYNQESGLYFWYHSYESGIDNSPRFTSVDEHTEYGVENLAAIDLNAEIVLQHQSLLNIMNRFTPDHPYKPTLITEMKRLSKQIQKILWDNQLGTFGDYDFKVNQLKTIDTIASYFPLVIQDLDPQIKAKMLEALRDPNRYNTKTPLPSVAKNSPHFIKDMWRGPVWINTAYIVIKGIEMQGEGKFAGELAYRLCKGVYETYQNEGNFFEFYDPDRYDLVELDRKKGNFYKKVTLGSKPVKNFAGWTADVNAILFENVIGIKKANYEWILEPHIPEEWLDKNFNIFISILGLNLEYRIKINKDKSDFEVDCHIDNKSFKGTIQNHERLHVKELN